MDVIRFEWDENKNEINKKKRNYSGSLFLQNFIAY